MKNHIIKSLFVSLLFTLSSHSTFAFEEEHEAHEHGHAVLMLVQEDDELKLTFESPAMNIVGFEHQANSTEQHQKLGWAKESLSDAKRLLLINEDAECALEHVHIASSLLEKDAHDDHDRGHDENHEDAHEDHTYDNEDSHSEFEAEYHFECKKIDALKEIKVALFEVFTSIEEIEAQIITGSGQQLLDLDQNNVSIKF